MPLVRRQAGPPADSPCSCCSVSLQRRVCNRVNLTSSQCVCRDAAAAWAAAPAAAGLSDGDGALWPRRAAKQPPADAVTLWPTQAADAAQHAWQLCRFSCTGCVPCTHAVACCSVVAGMLCCACCQSVVTSYAGHGDGASRVIDNSPRHVGLQGMLRGWTTLARCAAQVEASAAGSAAAAAAAAVCMAATSSCRTTAPSLAPCIRWATTKHCFMHSKRHPIHLSIHSSGCSTLQRL